MGRLDGAVALITGASSGIGEATAKALAAEGAAVSLVARRRDRLEALADDVDGRSLVVEADITDRDQATGAVDRTVAEFGRLDVVVNNAGVMLLGPILDAPIEEWDRMVALNVQGLLSVSHAALPHLLDAAGSGARGVADLVTISSVAGRTVRQGSGVYNLTKWGVNAFSESLRQEVTGRHVRVGIVEPGAVDTQLRNHLRDEVRQAQESRFQDVEVLQSADIADAITWMVTRPRRMAVNEMLVRPTEQGG